MKIADKLLPLRLAMAENEAQNTRINALKSKIILKRIFFDTLRQILLNSTVFPVGQVYLGGI